MFKLREASPNDFYDYCYSEYLTEKYPKDYFNFYIDIGACGVDSKWHINHMGKDNPNTLLIGFEPGENGFNLIKKECEQLSNVKLYKQFFGKDISLKEVLDNHNLDPNNIWCLSCDCEGDEKYLFNNPEELEILKLCAHIAFEIHPRMAGITYDEFVKLFLDNFSDTHKIIRTFHGGGGPGVLDNSSFILVRNDLYETIIKDAIKNFKYNWDSGRECMVQKLHYYKIRPEHHIKYIN